MIDQFNEKEIYEVKYVNINSMKYRSGVIISYHNCLYEIEKVLCIDADVVFFVKQLKYLGVDSFTRSLMVEDCDPVENTIIAFSSLSHKKVFAKRTINEKSFVIIDNLDLDLDLDLEPELFETIIYFDLLNF